MKELESLLHVERGFLSPEDTERYYHRLSDFALRGMYEYDCQTAWRAPSWYVPFLDIHEVCHDKMEEITGIELDPTYCFARRYASGDYLFPHTDRPECKVSCTINLAYGGENWSIWAGTPENPIFLEPGDAIIYNGSDVRHGREYMRIDQKWMYQVFVHFQPVDGGEGWVNEGMHRVLSGQSTEKKILSGEEPIRAPIIDA